jgi:hypothetical protein
LVVAYTGILPLRRACVICLDALSQLLPECPSGCHAYPIMKYALVVAMLIQSCTNMLVLLEMDNLTRIIT